ncbi:MAG: hypothetical protein QOF89_1601 [Acidobacteriota bacterium]|jgi:hypothetical protein|nr:hypothetical protein [Acidobacteriota bacterium]
MRKLSVFVLVFCMVLGLSAVAMAKDSGKEAKGAVTNVSPADKSLSIKGKTADETFWTNDTTKITENGKSITLADVKTGDWADVWYTAKDGKDWATKVVVKAPKDHKDAKKPGR